MVSGQVLLKFVNFKWGENHFKNEYKQSPRWSSAKCIQVTKQKVSYPYLTTGSLNSFSRCKVEHHWAIISVGVTYTTSSKGRCPCKWEQRVWGCPSAHRETLFEVYFFKEGSQTFFVSSWMCFLLDHRGDFQNMFLKKFYGCIKLEQIFEISGNYPSFGHIA